MENFNNIVKQLDLINIHKTVQPTKAKYYFELTSNSNQDRLYSKL